MTTALPRVLVVTESPRRLRLPGVAVASADAYLRGDLPAVAEDPMVLNLCRSMGYLSLGYYVSLVAEGRGHPVQPTVHTLESAGSLISFLRTLEAAGIPTAAPRRPRRPHRKAIPAVMALELGEDDLPQPLQSSESSGQVVLRPADLEAASAVVVLGRTTDVRFRRFAAAVYREFALPLFVLKLLRDRTWRVCGISLLPVTRLEAATMALLNEGISELSRGPRQRPSRGRSRPSVACLWDPEDEFAPSGPETLDRFAAAAQRLGANFTLLTRHESHRLAEHDALFIRTLTGLDRWPFAFQQKAVSLEMPVVDDPLSTIRCSNKIYLYEMLLRLGLAQPRSMVVTPQTPRGEIEALGFPLILKQPDGSFSASVKKVANAAEFQQISTAFFKRSPLLLVQEYLPSEYDWRIGILGGKILFAARYYMARGHWQILKTDEAGRPGRAGRVEAVPRESLDPAVVKLALEGARPIGSGLYGVDIKETPRGPVIIEINDNPNIDEGYEDQAERSRLYEEVIAYFLARIREQATSGSEGESP